VGQHEEPLEHRARQRDAHVGVRVCREQRAGEQEREREEAERVRCAARAGHPDESERDERALQQRDRGGERAEPIGQWSALQLGRGDELAAPVGAAQHMTDDVAERR
jgi:hypothetical protein